MNTSADVQPGQQDADVINQNDGGDLDGIDGWLLFVAAGVIIAPIVIALQLAGQLRHSHGPIPASVRALFLAYEIALIYFFFGKKRTFPALKIISLSAAFLMGAFSYFVAPAPHALFASAILVLSGASTAAWIGYFLVSKRVAATFRR